MFDLVPTGGGAPVRHTLEAEIVVEAWNKAGAYEIAEFYSGETTGAHWADGAFEACNHDVTMGYGPGAGWTRSDMANGVALKYTALHIGTHGTAAGDLLDDGTPGQWMNWFDFLQWRGSAETNGVPRVNLAFFDACSTGQSQTPASLLSPFANVVDRAAVAFTVCIDSGSSSQAGELFYQSIAAGKTAVSSLNDYIEKYNDVIESSGSEEFDPLVLDDNAVIVGDRYTRLRSVYTGAAPSPGLGTWWMVLP